MSPNFLPLLDDHDSGHLVEALARLGPFFIPSSQLSDINPDYNYSILADSSTAPSVENVRKWLDDGADKVVIPTSFAKDIIDHIPAQRLILLLDISNASSVANKIRDGVSGVLLRTISTELQLLSNIRQFFPNSDFFVQVTSATHVSLHDVRELKKNGFTPCIPISQLTLLSTSTTRLNIADAFLAPLSSDRPDNLFPSIVTSYLDGGKCLGFVYSSAESIKESILTGKGVYQSRERGLWRKGETSGSTQDLISIRADCDTDSLEFSVVQHGTGFCHLGTASCFGHLSGLSALEKTLKSRQQSGDPESYTRRLFDDPALLASKIKEEADELCRAETKEEVALEASDLIYFALTRSISKGVSLVDIERALDKKAKKVSRRPGNAKPAFMVPPINATVPPKPGDGKIRMRNVVLSKVTSHERHALLRRPVLDSFEMIAKVKPIVHEVRRSGDQAVIEFTAKFDNCKMDSTVILPPFSAAAQQLPIDVKNAIDQAYRNIHKFHAAQVAPPLEVQTLPGVTCSRHARPIARVGLYIPGGTAVLPSTALMLGIPAQVAGCKKIVLATPPRPDGSIVPEVMYVAHLVGASAILKAGGAQAIAAMAYGTTHVPKVDKIFGPGNQWVNAAKMLVQNDTEALVSIDLPAGPSEVLVIADSTANPVFVAADLLSQAEHGTDSQVILVAVKPSDKQLAEIEEKIDAQARALPRVDIVRQSIAKSLLVQVDSLDEAIQFSNDYAPEHLILHIAEAQYQDVLKKVENAGSVFVGPYTPESCGDYASGTNHTLPTNGYARQFSGVNTQSFQKHITSQHITKEGLKALGPTVITLARCEGLEAHANAVAVRIPEL